MRTMKTLRAQRGNSLIVALIIMGMITLLSITSLRISDNSIAVTGNLQHAEAVLNAANSVIQEAISTVRMVQSPDAIFLNPCGAQNTRCIDINGDAANDVTVVLAPAPTCVQARIIPVLALDLTADEDRPCLQGVAQTFGVAGAPSADSLCANTVFEVTAVATDMVTNAEVTVREGVAVKTTSDDVDTACP